MTASLTNATGLTPTPPILTIEFKALGAGWWSARVGPEHVFALVFEAVAVAAQY